MRIWLDCSSLMEWKFSHLTGIQRTVLGIYKGWKILGIEVHLFTFDQAIAGFVEIKARELPEVIWRNLESQEWISVAPPSKASPVPIKDKILGGNQPNRSPGKSWKRKVAHKILGEGLESSNLRQALVATKLDLWRTQRTGRTWAKARIEQLLNRTSSVIFKKNKHDPNAHGDISHIIGEGDYLFSLGSECYQMPANLEAAKKLQNCGAKLIRLIYDIIPASQPQWVTKEATSTFSKAVIDVISGSDYLLTISEYSRLDILQFARKEAIVVPSIQVIRLGDVLSSNQQVTLSEPEPHQRPSRPFFLCLGTVEPRKNHRLLYEAWRNLARTNPIDCPDLVCVGAHHPMCNQIIHEMTHDPLVQNRIFLLSEISDQQLEWYYQHCLATIFPSQYEGWGLPVAESLARGRMCLASNATSIPEISDLAIIFDPQDVVSLCDLILRTSGDSEWRASEEEKIRAQFKPTSWRATAEHVLVATERFSNPGMEAQEKHQPGIH